MKNKNLSELSQAELNGKEKTLKTVLGAYFGILFVLAVSIILLFVQKQYTIALPLLVVLISSSTVMFISKKQLNDVKKEMETRR